MKRPEDLWRQAHGHARQFLRRYEDPLTHAERDDIVQESAIAAWRWADTVREPCSFAAAVRTITRRKRSRALRACKRRRLEELTVDALRDDREPTSFVVLGRWVPREWLLAQLRRALDRLSPLDRRLLMAVQEGFCVAEIAERYRLTEHNVKVRTYRARHRVRMEIEDAVLTVESLDGFDQ